MARQFEMRDSVYNDSELTVHEIPDGTIPNAGPLIVLSLWDDNVAQGAGIYLTPGQAEKLGTLLQEWGKWQHKGWFDFGHEIDLLTLPE